MYGVNEYNVLNVCMFLNKSPTMNCLAKKEEVFSQFQTLFADVLEKSK